MNRKRIVVFLTIAYMTLARQIVFLKKKLVIQIKRFVHWYFFEPRKTLMEWFMKRFPNFPLYVSVISLLLVMFRPEVDFCIHHIRRTVQRLIFLLGL